MEMKILLSSIWHFFIKIGIFLIYVLMSKGVNAAYEISSSEIVSEAIKKSKEIKSLQYLLESNKILTEAEKSYFYPKLKLTAEYSNFDGQKVDPILEKDSELVLSINSLFYSDVTKDRILAADSKIASTYYQLVNRKSSIYYLVMEQLIKIERNREFLKESSWIKIKLDDYINQLEGAVEAGIYPKSYLRESQIVKVRFQSVVDTAQSNIDRYFNDLGLQTGYKVVDKDKTGVNSANIQIVMNYAPSFNFEDAVNNNIRIKSRFHEVESLKYLANAQDERLKLSFFSDINSGLIETSRNPFLDVRETSVAGIRVEVDVFDDRKYKTKNAFYKNYLAEKEILDDEIEKLSSQIQELKNKFDSSKNKRENLINQIALSESLLEDQENEILIDRIQFIDIIKSLSELIQTRVSQLDNDIAIIESVFGYQRVVGNAFSEKPQNEDR
jgi:outer membrane protein TolC